jgi:hypothetical protein
MKKILTFAFLLILVLGQAGSRASAQAEELIVNGNFEIPEVDTNIAFWAIHPDGTPGLGWQLEWFEGALEYQGVTRPDVAYIEYHHISSAFNVFEGHQYAELDSDWPGPTGGLMGEPASLKIYQDVSTCATGVYELKYAWSPRLNKPESAMEVWWGDTLVASHAGAGGPQNVWTLETHAVTASGSSTRLAFIETGTPDGLGMFLDAVSLIQTLDCQKEVDIDHKPGKYPNYIRLSSTKLVPVAVLGSETFDVAQIDPASLMFAGLHVHMNHPGHPHCQIMDVSGDFTRPTGAPDGFPDLWCTFTFVKGDFSPNADGTVTLTGSLYDGTTFWGTDSVTIRP